jgi:DNA-binding MarR family transcriptional regulator
MDMEGTKDSNALVFAYICQYIERHGYSPCVREIARECVLSLTATVRHLGQLEALGLIERKPRVARSITLKKPVSK